MKTHISTLTHLGSRILVRQLQWYYFWFAVHFRPIYLWLLVAVAVSQRKPSDVRMTSFLPRPPLAYCKSLLWHLRWSIKNHSAPLFHVTLLNSHRFHIAAVMWHWCDTVDTTLCVAFWHRWLPDLCRCCYLFSSLMFLLSFPVLVVLLYVVIVGLLFCFFAIACSGSDAVAVAVVCADGFVLCRCHYNTCHRADRCRGPCTTSCRQSQWCC